MTETTDKQKLSTDVLFQEIEKNGTVDKNDIHFIGQEEILLELYNRIAAIPASINKFAGMCDTVIYHATIDSARSIRDCWVHRPGA